MATIKSIEEKAKAYDGNYKIYKELINRLEDVKYAIKKQNYGIAMNILCKPYPEFQITTSTELKESEDERIRKAIYNCVKWFGFDSCFFKDVSQEKCLAWLEKQGEHAKFLNSIQVGDQVTRNENGELFNLSLLKRVSKPAENKGKNNMGISEATKQELEDNLNKALEKETPESWNEFLEKQKPAEYKEIPTDIRSIVDKEANAIWKEINTGHNHSIIDTFNQFYGICMQVAEAVMEYNKPAEWSDIDLISLGYLADFVDKNGDEFYGKNKPNVVKWIHSFANLTTPQQEWSEEDLYKIELALFGTYAVDVATRLLDKIKSLRPQNMWKPSDGQMEALSIAMQGVNDPLFSLYQDLKKLREE